MNKKSENLKNILIIGANGYLGSNLLKYLSKDNENNLSILLNKNDNKIRNFKNFKNIKVYYDEDTSILGYDTILNKIDIIFYLASIKGKSDYDSIYSENITKPVKLAILADKNKVGKIIYISSYQVNYLNHKYSDKSSLNNNKLNYRVSKLILEKRLSNLTNIDLPVYLIRFPMIVGANMEGRLNFLFFLNKYRLPFPFKKFSYSLRLISITNVIKILILTANLKNNKFTIFNFDSKIKFDIKQLVSKISLFSNIKSYNFYFPSIAINFFLNLLLSKNNINHLESHKDRDDTLIKDTMNYFSLNSDIDLDLKEAVKYYFDK